ncbi:MAG: histidine phosphatase family protein [Chlorobium phaeobacteroides]|nr:histidine phosphatase family protein [Chlorobium phaeobacteroides]
MKTLYLVRHAKSSWDNARMTDFERPLNEIGIQSAPIMARLLKEKKVCPDLVIASPANRAITTARIFCDIIDYPEERIETRMEIYQGGAENLLHLIRKIPDNHTTAMIFGHNPTLTDLSNALVKEQIDNLATAGIVRIDFDTNSWKETAAGEGKRVWYETPKKQKT